MFLSALHFTISKPAAHSTGSKASKQPFSAGRTDDIVHYNLQKYNANGFYLELTLSKIKANPNANKYHRAYNVNTSAVCNILLSPPLKKPILISPMDLIGLCTHKLSPAALPRYITWLRNKMQAVCAVVFQRAISKLARRAALSAHFPHFKFAGHSLFRSGTMAS